MTTKAIVYKGAGDINIEDVPIKQTPPGYVLVNVGAWAINPIDWKALDYGLLKAPAVFGFDAAGTVSALGDRLAEPLSKGDRLIGH